MTREKRRCYEIYSSICHYSFYLFYWRSFEICIAAADSGKYLRTGADVYFVRDKSTESEAVQDAGKFLIEIMPMMFIPAGVGLLNAWDKLKPVLVPVIVIMFISTIAVMGISGKVTQTMIEAEERKKNEGHSE